MIGYLARSGLPAVSREVITFFDHASLLALAFDHASIYLVSFLFVYGPPLRLGPQKRKKRDPGQYPVTLTLRLVIESA